VRSHGDRSAPRVALVTYAGLRDLSRGDRLLARALGEHGALVHAIPWDDEGVDWSSFEAVVIRSTWDYHLRVGEFLAWISELERDGIPLWNPPRVVRWNAEKSYLGQLADVGVSVVPTMFIGAEDERSLAEVLAQRGWSRAVVKPAVSASAHETWTTTLESAPADERRFREQTTRGRTLVQPFVRELAERGEWSLIFIENEFSHGVLKRAAAGDFRVQEEHGGESVLTEAPPALLSAAARVRAIAARLAGVTASDLLYARVDGCQLEDGLCVTEIELVEPSLFLELQPSAADLLARAIRRRIGEPARETS
jgi:glutathione synthase/RimK-type ligase-like ATP-grasp enzyme